MRSTTGLSLLFIGSLALVGCGGDDSVAAAEAAPRPAIGLLTAEPAVVVEVKDEIPGEVSGEQPWTETPMVMRVSEPFFGDWDAIRERGVLRVLVSYSRTNFFLSEGRLRGFEYEMFNELQQQLAKQASASHPPLQIVYFPVPFDELLSSLQSGHGDVAAASLTVTPERERNVSFTDPYQRDVDQVFVSHVGLPPVQSWEDLAGRTIHVVAGTSFCAQLERLNADLIANGLEPLKLEYAARGLHTEDLLELVHSGAFEYTVADRFMAELWSGVLDGIRIESDCLLGTGSELAWAVRRSSPELKDQLDEFISANKRGSLIGNVLFKRYYVGAKWISNPLLDVEHSKLGPFLEPMQRYSDEFGFDWRVIAAQAYQESRLDPTTVSPAGAVGLMQLLPSTAADMGVTELDDPERSLYAGIKYMDWLRRTKFDEPQLSAEAQLDFCLAAYNAGATRVRRWRAAAPGRGLDPDVWFGNVELLALEDVGVEPVRYVGNINKYYILFAMSLDSIELSQRARVQAGEAEVGETKEATAR